MFVLVIEGWDADDHLIDEDAEGPPVQGMVMAGTKNHLRRQVLRCAAEGVRLLPLRIFDLGEAEVRKEDVSIIVEQDILRLQVPVDDSAAV